MIGGKNSYHVHYNNGTTHFYNPDGSLIEELEEIGWYVRVSHDATMSLPWGPFADQREAMESLLIEWERFEPGYFVEEKEMRNPMDGITITESETDPNSLCFDLDNDAVKLFEELLGTAYDSPTFQAEFESFVEKALTEQLDRLDKMNEAPAGDDGDANE